LAKKIIYSILDFFSFSSSERKGLIILLLLIIIAISLNAFLPLFTPDKSQLNIKQWEQIEAFLDFQEKQHFKASHQNKKEVPKTKRELFSFNPNTLSKNGWLKLGLLPWQITIIKNYLSKGGHFTIKNDLKKIYGIADSTFFLLEPFIMLPDKKNFEADMLNLTSFNPNDISESSLIEMGFEQNLINSLINYRKQGGRFYKKEDMKTLFGINDSMYIEIESFIDLPEDLNNDFVKKVIFAEVEINTADTLDMQQLPGIGPSFAKKIIKYRDLLGGYSNKSQLLEVYGMDTLRYNLFTNQILIDTSLINQININEANVKQLIQHPYIEFYIAKAIIVYRETHHGFERLDELNNLDEIYPELFIKLSPYFYIGKLNIAEENNRKKKLR